ncbi:hypothetical protein BJX99DRAFT_258717 [Aspergillus californicus]
MPHPLNRGRFVTDENAAAIQGERVPRTVRGRSTVSCVVCGIRYHDGFARDMRGIPELPELTRALNARDITSNRVPEMHTAQEVPYCFWHPDVPREETLRELLTRYPDNALLPYQVRRACAVGGYTDLYRSLDIFPDVSIAEEARGNRNTGEPIYRAIMDAPIRYAYMDDYGCCLREKPIPGAHMNGRLDGQY